VSTLKHTYESLMRMMYVSKSTSCMISIRPLDERGSSLSSMNLERNWGHYLVNSWWLMFERTRRKVRRRTALCIRYRCHWHEIQVQQYRFHLCQWSDSESSNLKVLKNFGLSRLTAGPYTFFVGSIHNANYKL
jgi:hypothetical protein